MKNTLRTQFAIFILLTGFARNSTAQEIPIDIIQRCYRADYIFEGKVIRSTAYWNLDHKFIYTSNTIEIYKIFKGDISCGTIEVITLGGCIKDTCLDISHNITLKKEMLGIFMCTQTNRELSAVDFYPESNPAKLQVKFGDQGFIRYFDDYANYEVSDWEFQLDSLAQVYDLLDLYAQLNYVNCGKAPGFVHVRQKKSAEKTAELPTHNPHKIFPPSNSIKVQGTCRRAGVDTTIYYDILNPQIVETYPQRHFDFDVALSDQMNGAYLWTAAFLIEYDTVIFGTDVWTNGNIAVTPAGISSLPAYGDPQQFINDVNGFNNIVAFEIFPSGSGLLHDLSASPQIAAHVSLTMNTCDTIGNIFLDDPETYSPARFDTSHDGTSPPFYYSNAVIQTGALTVPKCSMHITGITPTTVNGGVGDTVTITGFNFRDAKGSGDVFLKDAQNGGQYFLKLEYMDYKTWNDTQIVFRMPSYIDSLYTLAPNQSFGVPGSGEIKLYNDVGDSVVGNNINVFYSVSNRKAQRDSITPFKKYVNLLYNAKPDTMGGYLFHPDTSVIHRDSIMMCFTAAIHDWNCQTNVNFQIGDSIITTGNSPYGEWDSTSTIRISNSLDSGTIAQTSQWTFPSVCDRVFVTDIDILLNSMYVPFFRYDTSACDTIFPNQIDFYWDILHEIGHAHSLSHINDSTKIMWYRKQNPLDTIFPDHRLIYLYLDTPADSGGARVMQFVAEDSIHLSCYKGNMIPYYPACSPHMPPPHGNGNGTESLEYYGCWPHPYVEEISKPNIQLSVFPNPSNAEMNFQFTTDETANIRFKICDYMGKELFSSDSRKESKGIHKIKFDVTNLSTGLYLVFIKVNDFDYNIRFIRE